MKCPVCRQTFVYAGHYQRHLKEHRVTVAESCDIEAVENALRVGDGSQIPYRRL